MEKLNKIDEQELQETLTELDERERAWGSNKAKEREQEIRLMRSELEKIGGSSGSQKREQEDIKSSKKAKKRKYNVEP